MSNVIDADHIRRQIRFSMTTFGPGPRLHGVLDHLAKELEEARANPEDVSEWADIIILAIDGAWRQGYLPQEILDAVIAKQDKNEQRQWPDWRDAPEGKAIEHHRG